MEGWQRGDWFDSTGLQWVNTSPNLRSLTEATLYPGVGMIEGANVSVGRGTDAPFEIVGAPWVKGRELAAYLNGRDIQSVRFVPIVFTPSASNFAGERCEGVNPIVLDRNTLDSPELGIELASALHKLYRNDFKLERMADLLVNRAVLEGIDAGERIRGGLPRTGKRAWRSLCVCGKNICCTSSESRSFSAFTVRPVRIAFCNV